MYIELQKKFTSALLKAIHNHYPTPFGHVTDTASICVDCLPLMRFNDIIRVVKISLYIID